MSIEQIAFWLGLIAAILTILNFVIMAIKGADIKHEFSTFIRLIIIGILGAPIGFFIWVISSPIFGGIFGYGLGSIFGGIIGAIGLSIGFITYLDNQKGEILSNTSKVIVVILFSSIIWVIGWFSLNEFYNNILQIETDYIRGILSNIIGWGIACVIGNVLLLPIFNFISYIFKD
jgi:hypothetical protein